MQLLKDAYENVPEQPYISKPLYADLCIEFLVVGGLRSRSCIGTSRDPNLCAKWPMIE
jgi:hypothetical protein